jgi:outer membrane protein assembly factor BamA
MREAADTLERRLHNLGYPRAQILRSYEVDTVSRAATLEFSVSPGPLSRIGTLDIVVTPREGRPQEISDRNIRSIIGVKEGDIYNERRLVNAQRSLYQTEAYQRVEISLDPDTMGTLADSTATVRVRLTENYMHSTDLGVGWGTLDCFRASGAFTNRDFLNGARRLEMTARTSKIGVGRPLDARILQNGLCKTAGPRTDDLYAKYANYYLGATLRQPVFLGLRTVPTITLFSERRSEFKAYLSQTPIGGIASIARQRNPALPMTFAYELSLGRTEAQPALLCAVFNRCAPDEQNQLKQTKRLAVASWAVSHSTANNTLNPEKGAVVRVELRHASSVILSDRDLQFNKGLADASWYIGTPSGVLAFRVRMGRVLGAGKAAAGSQQFIPPQERLFAGGASSVRGFRQNELGPIVYQARSFRPEALDGTPIDPTGLATGDTVYLRMDQTQKNFILRNVPAGGNALVVGSAEARLRSPFYPSVVQWALFVDVGQVWNPGSSQLSFQALRWTPGAGVRVFSPLGAIRVDIGYNRYPLEAGSVYANAPGEIGQAALLCVGPGNTIPSVVTKDATGTVLYSQSYTKCDGRYQPTKPSQFFRRLTLNFSIGQAF